jgi:hypothetical protein
MHITWSQTHALAQKGSLDFATPRRKPCFVIGACTQNDSESTDA